MASDRLVHLVEADAAGHPLIHRKPLSGQLVQTDGAAELVIAVPFGHPAPSELHFDHGNRALR